MKLMDIDSDTLGIPDTEYEARVTMPSSEFSRIVRDLSLLGESVRIEVSKEGVRFASEGEAANGSVLIRQTESIAGGKITAKNGDEEEEDKDGDGEGEEAGGSSSQKKAKKPKVKKEKKGDEDVEMDDEDGEKENDDEFKPRSDDEGEEEKEDEEDEDEDEDGSSKKRKKKVTIFFWKLDLFTDLSARQTVLGKQVKNLKSLNRKKGKLLKTVTKLPMVSLSR